MELGEVGRWGGGAGPGSGMRGQLSVADWPLAQTPTLERAPGTVSHLLGREDIAPGTTEVGHQMRGGVFKEFKFFKNAKYYCHHGISLQLF